MARAEEIAERIVLDVVMRPGRIAPTVEQVEEFYRALMAEITVELRAAYELGRRRGRKDAGA